MAQCIIESGFTECATRREVLPVYANGSDQNCSQQISIAKRCLAANSRLMYDDTQRCYEAGSDHAMTRWMHPPERLRARERDQFDPLVEGERYHLSRELSFAIWERVCADATDSAGRCNEGQARERFHELAAHIAACGGRLSPDVGRMTRVGVELDGAILVVSGADELRPRTPGRETLVAAEARRWAHRHGEPAMTFDGAKEANEAEKADEAMEQHAPPGASEVAQAMAALRASPRPDQETRLEASGSGRIGRLFGFGLSKIDRESASSTAIAVVQDGETYSALTLSRAISEPSDAAEREADVVASRVVAGNSVRVATAPSASLQRAVDGEQAATITAEQVLDALASGPRGPGRPLDQATRDYFEPRFGVDLSGVQIHDDPTAHEAAARLNARAFTAGRDIGFAKGGYAPEMPEGRRLLAHELAHVAQQAGAPPAGRALSHPSDATEREADDAAARVVAGDKVRLAAKPAASVQCAPQTGTSTDGAEYEADVRHFFEHIIDSFALFGSGDLATRVNLVLNDPGARAFAAGLGAPGLGAPGLGALDDTRSVEALDVAKAVEALSAHPERYTLEALMERRNVGVRSALTSAPAKPQNSFALPEPALKRERPRLGALVPSLEIPSQEDLSEFALLRGHIAGLHGKPLKTLDSYLAYRRVIFDSNENYRAEAALADQEFDAKPHLMAVMMEGDTTAAKKVLYRWVRKGICGGA